MLIVALAARLRDGVSHTCRGSLSGVGIRRARPTRMVILRKLAHVGTCDVRWIVIRELYVDRLSVVGEAYEAFFISCVVVGLCRLWILSFFRLCGRYELHILLQLGKQLVLFFDIGILLLDSVSLLVSDLGTTIFALRNLHQLLWHVVMNRANGLQDGLFNLVGDAKLEQVLKEELQSILSTDISELLSSNLCLLLRGLLGKLPLIEWLLGDSDVADSLRVPLVEELLKELHHVLRPNREQLVVGLSDLVK